MLSRIESRADKKFDCVGFAAFAQRGSSSWHEEMVKPCLDTCRAREVTLPLVVMPQWHSFIHGVRVIDGSVAPCHESAHGLCQFQLL